jgi:hypothetical protein
VSVKGARLCTRVILYSRRRETWDTAEKDTASKRLTTTAQPSLDCAEGGIVARARDVLGQGEVAKVCPFALSDSLHCNYCARAVRIAVHLKSAGQMLR